MRPAHCNGSEMLDQLSCLRDTPILKKINVLNARVAKKEVVFTLSLSVENNYQGA